MTSVMKICGTLVPIYFLSIQFHPKQMMIEIPTEFLIIIIIVLCKLAAVILHYSYKTSKLYLIQALASRPENNSHLSWNVGYNLNNFSFQ